MRQQTKIWGKITIKNTWASVETVGLNHRISLKRGMHGKTKVWKLSKTQIQFTELFINIRKHSNQNQEKNCGACLGSFIQLVTKQQWHGLDLWKVCCCEQVKLKIYTYGVCKQLINLSARQFQSTSRQFSAMK